MPDDRKFQPGSSPFYCGVYQSRFSGNLQIRLEDQERLGIGYGETLTTDEARKMAAALIECAEYVEEHS